MGGVRDLTNNPRWLSRLYELTVRFGTLLPWYCSSYSFSITLQVTKTGGVTYSASTEVDCEVKSGIESEVNVWDVSSHFVTTTSLLVRYVGLVTTEHE